MKLLKGKKENKKIQVFKTFLESISKIYFDVVSSDQKMYKITNISIPDNVKGKSVQVQDSNNLLYFISFTNNSIIVQKQVNNSELSIKEGDIVSLGDFEFITKVFNIAKSYFLQQINGYASKSRIRFSLDNKGNVEMISVPLKMIGGAS